MQANARWVALATIVTAVAAGAWALSGSWVELHGAAGKVIRHLSYPRDAETWGGALAGWSWFAAVFAAAGLGFGMLVGARRNYLPRVLPLALAILGALATIGVVLAIRFVGTVDHVEVYFDNDIWEKQFAKGEFGVSTSLHVALVSAIVLVVSAGALFRIAREVAKATEAELAKVDRDLAIRDGDLGVPPPPEDEVKL